MLECIPNSKHTRYKKPDKLHNSFYEHQDEPSEHTLPSSRMNNNKCSISYKTINRMKKYSQQKKSRKQTIITFRNIKQNSKCKIKKQSYVITHTTTHTQHWLSNKLALYQTNTDTMLLLKNI